MRQELGFSTAIIQDVNEGLKSFGFSERNRQRVLLRAWEGLNVYDVLFQIYLRIRPTASDRTQLDRIYENCCRKMFDALSEGRIRSGIDEVLHDLYQVSVTENGQRPRIAVTGDYYTRLCRLPTIRSTIKLNRWALLSGLRPRCLIASKCRC